MTKIVTIHQPNYLPWIGLFSKIMRADCFVIADTFSLGSRSAVNRNKIRSNNGWLFLTVPIGHRCIGERICNIKLPQNKDWQRKHLNAIVSNYNKAPFFGSHRDFFEKLYDKDFEYLCQINEEIILYLFKCFKIELPVLKASQMSVDPNLPTTDYLISLVTSAGGDIYLSGPSGRNYMQLEKFSKQNMGLKFFKFEHPVYKQKYPGFEPNMSAIDLLFNVGPRAGEIIRASGNVED